MSTNQIIVWNRQKKREETESIYGNCFLRMLYENPIGLFLVRYVLSIPLFSHIYGKLQNITLSTRWIKPFIQKYKIDMRDYENREFSHFNDFFIRRFQENARSFEKEKDLLPAFCEGRYLAYSSLEKNTPLPIKEKFLSLEQLLRKKEWIEHFEKGPALIVRLCPTDYHRFHYPDSGKTIDHYSLAGLLHSVNPIALKEQKHVLSQNERQVSILECENFAKLAYIEIGALCVGKIVQTNEEVSFHRGQEKGYFLFGASTVILLGERNAWLPDRDIVEQSEKGRESFIELGKKIASRKRIER